MKKSLRFFVIQVIAIALTATLGLSAASAHSDVVKYRWLASAGMHDFGFLCGPDQNPPCPDAAMASNGDIIEIVGEGTLLTKKGKHKRVRGGGSYRHTDMNNNLVDVGTWTAKKLLSFESFGPSNVLPPHWSQGLAFIRIKMLSQFDDSEAIATLELGCRLPEPFTETPPGTIEGIRLNVRGGPNFFMAMDPRATLFMQVSDDHDDDHDD